ncbi:hypothetical protein U8607_14845 [Methylobacterium durans]|uniref:DUF1508 domain-containing protein n=1 Tax=Methylobacterium durans TaxID=2202825 RepID=A0A2U8WAP6_9HYPH|nr:hypothetical protein [Methylobacterium durans]AWN43217.1 hypothetical protein DK389_25330 [Methylobacterium durans]MEA1833360.1 hypothetical protein [Methylobacterium durans]
MGANLRHLYTLEIRPSREHAGHYCWAIRERGKLYRRSDKPHPSEAEARAVAEAEIERLLDAPERR